MKKTGLVYRLFDFYRDGFSHMEIGKTLWIVIIVKLVIIFFVLRLFLMPDMLKMKAGKGNEAEYVSSRLTDCL